MAALTSSAGPPHVEPARVAPPVPHRLAVLEPPCRLQPLGRRARQFALLGPQGPPPCPGPAAPWPRPRRGRPSRVELPRPAWPWLAAGAGQDEAGPDLDRRPPRRVLGVLA